VLDISRIVVDPRFSQTFIVSRKTGTWNADGDFIEVPNNITMIGTISIASAKQIEFIPEGDRVGGEIAIHTIDKLLASRNNDDGTAATADEIFWHDEYYKIYQVKEYSDFGYYFAIAQRKRTD